MTKGHTALCLCHTSNYGSTRIFSLLRACNATKFPEDHEAQDRVGKYFRHTDCHFLRGNTLRPNLFKYSSNHKSKPARTNLRLESAICSCKPVFKSYVGLSCITHQGIPEERALPALIPTIPKTRAVVTTATCMVFVRAICTCSSGCTQTFNLRATWLSISDSISKDSLAAQSGRLARFGPSSSQVALASMTGCQPRIGRGLRLC